MLNFAPSFLIFLNFYSFFSNFNDLEIDFFLVYFN